jgi:serine/threonine protein kinase
VTLRSLLGRGAIPVPQATAILAGILSGLTQGRVLHLDVAPENVWIDAAGMVKPTDFGLVNLRRPTPAFGARPPPSVPWPTRTAMS